MENRHNNFINCEIDKQNWKNLIRKSYENV